MTKIFVNLPALFTGAQGLGQSGDSVQQSGAVISNAGAGAPSYDGQFAPWIQTIASEGNGKARSSGTGIWELGERVDNKANQFQAADEQSASTVNATETRFLSWFENDVPDYLKFAGEWWKFTKWGAMAGIVTAEVVKAGFVITEKSGKLPSLSVEGFPLTGLGAVIGFAGQGIKDWFDYQGSERGAAIAVDALFFAAKGAAGGYLGAAAFGAGVAVAGFFGAPALLAAGVGIAAWIGTDLAIDAISNYVFPTVHDYLVPKVAEFIDTTGKAIGDFAYDAVQTVDKAFDSITSGIGSLFH
jgi:hypothetical protein